MAHRGSVFQQKEKRGWKEVLALISDTLSRGVEAGEAQRRGRKQ